MLCIVEEMGQQSSPAILWAIDLLEKKCPRDEYTIILHTSADVLIDRLDAGWELGAATKAAMDHVIEEARSFAATLQ